jgi:transcriptional regulator with XRE-family HTH domain
LATLSDEERRFRRKFGDRIKELRVARDLSQRELAIRAGVLPSGISRWETSETLPTVYNALLVAKALDVGLDELCENIWP